MLFGCCSNYVRGKGPKASVGISMELLLSQEGDESEKKEKNKMHDDFYSLPKGTPIIKLPRMPPCMLKMITLGAVMMCSIYVSSLCLKQTEIQMKSDFTRTKSSYDSQLVSFHKREIQIKPALRREKQMEEHSYDGTAGNLKPTDIRIKPALSKTRLPRHLYDSRIAGLAQPVAETKPDSVNIEVLEEHSNDSRIVSLKKPVIDTKRESVSTILMEEHSFDSVTTDLKKTYTSAVPYTVNTAPTAQQSYDPRIVGLRQTYIQIRPGQMAIRPIGQKLNVPGVVSLKQTKFSVKPELKRKKSRDQQPSGPGIADVKQIAVQTKRRLVRSKLTQLPCHDPGIPQSELPYVHYPVPTNYRRRECACTPVRFYVIVTTQRSGSKWLESLLNSHVNISSNGELFIDREKSANLSAITQTLDGVYNLDLEHTSHRSSCTAAVGFKWMLNQGLLKNHVEVSKYFKRRGVSIIFLFRRNLLRRMISLLANAEEHSTLNGTHKPHVLTQQEADILASYKPKLDARLLVSRLKHAAAEAPMVKERFKGIRHMFLYYEDLVQNNNQKLTEIMDFLRVPQRNLSSRHVKIHTRPLSEMIRNWNAIRRALKGTPFESFLTSD